MTTHDQSHHEMILNWLSDTYDMEKRLLLSLEDHTTEIKDYPEWNARLQQAADECQHHINLLHNCIERAGGKAPLVRGGVEAIMEWVESVGSMEFPDQMIKNLMNDLGLEQSMAACYKVLVTAAEHNGEQEIAETCRKIQSEKESMARWLYDNIDRATNEFLHHKAADE